MATDVCVFDGYFVVQYFKPRDCDTFGEYASKMFVPHVKKALDDSKQVDIVWDTYRVKTIKGETREKRGSGQRRRIEGTTLIPKDWQSFLRNSENKTELYAFLSNSVLSLMEPGNKEVIVNHEDMSLSSDIQREMRDFKSVTMKRQTVGS